MRGGRGSVVHSDHSLSIAREGFLCRGATLINKLDVSLRNETKLEMFKKGLKQWVKKNIKIKPTQKFPSVSCYNFPPRPMPPPTKPDPTPMQNSIRRYLIQRRSSTPPSPPRYNNKSHKPTLNPNPTLSLNNIRRYFSPLPTQNYNNVPAMTLPPTSSWPCYPSLPPHPIRPPSSSTPPSTDEQHQDQLENE